MPWTAGPGAGFTTGRPWLRLGADAATRNVEAQAADPARSCRSTGGSWPLRAATPALQVGDSGAPPGCDRTVRRPTFGRSDRGRRSSWSLNLGRGPVTLAAPRRSRRSRPGRSLLSTHDRPPGERLLRGGNAGARGATRRPFSRLASDRPRPDLGTWPTPPATMTADPRHDAGEPHVPLDFLKRKGSADAAAARPPRTQPSIRTRCCPRRSSPRTTSSSCTTRARAARASA